MKSKVIAVLIFCALLLCVPLISFLPQKGGGSFNSPKVDTPKNMGEFKILNQSTGQVETVSERDFVIGAVASEMPASFHTEALKAQAVASHTYAVYQRQLHRETPDSQLKGADFAADPENYQVYITEEVARNRFGQNFDSYWKKITEAVDSVLGQVITYDGSPIVAAYHAMSSGNTEDCKNIWSGNGLPYLVPVESPGDLLAPDYEAKVSFSADEVSQKLKIRAPDLQLPEDPGAWFSLGERTASGTLLGVTVGGSTFTGVQLRSALGLRSANFTVSFADGQFSFVTKGYGHGVGMSQYGADYFARQGQSYDAILAHYYKETTLTTIKSK